ncbi:putative receptor-like protein kinase At3g47110 [Papaver somniferum]|uniref:putative receptor-like protein kinase At3g47110 n=1 Tax=Papaver somniferum TaxID=3469 RepID=UPI000E6F9BAB|nr:putative receptor-like protein kinase At3g47110 [Papaver somniferum]
MSFLLIICAILVSWSLNFSPAAFQSHFTYGNETDRLALFWFKSEITYYQEGALVSWKNHSDHCTWSGIKCNREHPRRVTVLELSHLHLGDYIPTVIGNLTFLMTLRLSYNNFCGEIPQEIGRLFRLQFLDLSYNQLSGEIPQEIGHLFRLQSLHLSYNYLSGEIPSSLKNCVDLKRLYLTNNDLNGKIPPSLQSLKGIQELILERNGLSGPVPEYLESFHFLKKLDLSYNQLSGEIPEEIGRLFELQFLDLSDNQLSGEIPSSLKNCLDLKGLYLSSNYFEGIIPPSFQSLKAIQELILDRNNLSGPIPDYLESFSSLKTLDLSWNNFQGEVPNKGIFNKTSPLFNFYNVGNKDLCGGNPLLQLPSCAEVNKHFPLKRLLLLLSGVVISVIVLGSVRKFFSWKKARKKPSSSDSDSLNGDSSESPFTDMFHKVSYKELFVATNGFSAKNIVGVGGYGSVYIGILMLSQEITSVVAVKVLDLQRRGALKSFKAECEALRCIRHRNVLKILTSCSSIGYKGNEFKALV